MTSEGSQVIYDFHHLREVLEYFPHHKSFCSKVDKKKLEKRNVQLCLRGEEGGNI